MINTPELSLETLAAQALGRAEPGTRAISPSIHLATTYRRDVTDEGYADGRIYTRDENPMYDTAETLIAKLEHGEKALLFASGMAAASAMLLALPEGGHIVAPNVAFITMVNLLKDRHARGIAPVSWYGNADKEGLKNAIIPGKTVAVLVETPGNPTWEATDIAYAADLAHAAGAVLIVDNTIASPVLTKPLDLGADYVWHSATKYLNGHHDMLAGVAITKEDTPYWQQLHTYRRMYGATLGSFETWQLLRGMQTLYPRMRIACENAQAVAEFLEGHDMVERVMYPGLPSDPNHTVCAKQMGFGGGEPNGGRTNEQPGFGAMLSFLIKGDKRTALQFIQQLQVFQCATSLGGTLSLIDHRKTIEGEDSPLPDTLLRLSIGTEVKGDLIADLKRGFELVQSK